MGVSVSRVAWVPVEHAACNSDSNRRASRARSKSASAKARARRHLAAGFGAMRRPADLRRHRFSRRRSASRPPPFASTSSRVHPSLFPSTAAPPPARRTAFGRGGGEDGRFLKAPMRCRTRVELLRPRCAAGCPRSPVVERDSAQRCFKGSLAADPTMRTRLGPSRSADDAEASKTSTSLTAPETRVPHHEAPLEFSRATSCGSGAPGVTRSASEQFGMTNTLSGAILAARNASGHPR